MFKRNRKDCKKKRYSTNGDYYFPNKSHTPEKLCYPKVSYNL